MRKVGNSIRMDPISRLNPHPSRRENKEKTTVIPTRSTTFVKRDAHASTRITPVGVWPCMYIQSIAAASGLKRMIASRFARSSPQVLCYLPKHEHKAPVDHRVPIQRPCVHLGRARQTVNLIRVQLVLLESTITPHNIYTNATKAVLRLRRTALTIVISESDI